jgi:hypothetical protein
MFLFSLSTPHVHSYSQINIHTYTHANMHVKIVMYSQPPLKLHYKMDYALCMYSCTASQPYKRIVKWIMFSLALHMHSYSQIDTHTHIHTNMHIKL